MKGVATLIKLEKRKIDELKREMNKLEEERAARVTEMQRLQNELQRELNTASQMNEMRQFFGNFSSAIRDKQKVVAKHILQIDEAAKVISRKISEHFSELKKYEIAQAEWVKAQKKKRALREQNELDEIGLQVTMRRQAKEGHP